MSDESEACSAPREEVRRVNWPHAPPHRLGTTGSYFVTAATYLKKRLFHDPARLDLLHDSLLSHAKESGWQLEAWAVFSNHYHFVARPATVNSVAADVGRMVKAPHERTAIALNRMDGQPGRRVWHNYWDTHLTFERSLMARLNYTMQNPVKHRLVERARDYPWCSVAWFERVSTGAWVQTVYGFKTDGVKVVDDFEP